MEITGATGALTNVVRKLGQLLIGEYNLQKGVKGEIMFLQSELEMMQVALEKISNTPADQLDIQDKIWARELKELAYDIEDTIDIFMYEELVDGNRQAELHGIMKFIDASVGLFRKANKRHAEIRGIKSRIEEVAKRRQRYKMNTDVANKPIKIDPRLHGQYEKVSQLVSIEEASEELIKKILAEENQVSMRQHGTIVSIVGFEGMGKTTLANAVYEKIRGQFDCCAFASVSQTPDFKTLFKGLLNDLGKNINEEALDESRLIKLLRELLQEKRYFIVIDDIWDISDWKTIKYALPDNDVGYTIITTTRISDVAEHIGGAYKINYPLKMFAGALPNVIKKLGELLIGDYNLQKGVKVEIRFLQSELESMQGALEKVFNTPADQLDIQDKIWARKLSELSYDIEHSIDTIMVRGHSNEQAKLHDIKKFTERSVSLLKEVRDRYKISSDLAKPVGTTIDPRLLDLYTEPVGIDVAREEVIKILTEGNEVSEQQGKIVSIVGLGGLGKTTLANAVYEKLRAQFDCSAFVSVSQTPDMKKLFKSMLYQFGKKNSANIGDDGTLDIRQLIVDLNEFLQKKRYITVIDDIWDISVWKMIRCALPGNNDGYRIITTTRVLDVAQQIGGAYMLKPLSLHSSRMLLFTKLFGKDNDKCTDDHLTKLYDRILTQCAGIPLAIITIASSLASKEGNKIEWYNVYKSVGYGLQKSVDAENIRKILLLSYYNLPQYLRTCLLYLSIFPEDYDIDKNRLIWLWIAEGFIQCEQQGDNLFEIGEKYFHELIDRSMIQLLHHTYTVTTEYCRVHDMVLDLIQSLSSEENFVTIGDDIENMHLSKEIRRLSLQNSKVDHAAPLQATMRMQQVRSVVVFPSTVNLLPDLPHFRVLRVLDLQDCFLAQDFSLKQLGNLFHLRYLGLRATGIALLPEEIGNLKHLQTLDISVNKISSLPPTVLQLKNLMCLHIDALTRVPNGIGSLRSLEELSTLCIDNSTDIIEELGHLTELRVLGIECCTSTNIHSLGKSLVECLHKLQKIQSLSIWVSDVCNLDAWVAPQHLRRLELTGCWSRMPSSAWMNPLLVLQLSFLSIEVRMLKQRDVEILGMLPVLRYLNLDVYHQNLRILGGFIAGPCSFPCLVQCELLGFIGPVVFEQGAMPRLATLRFTFPVRLARENTNSSCGFDSGLRNLPSLRNVTVIFRPGGAGEGEVEEAKAAVRHVIEYHPNNPTLKTYVVQD